MKRFMISMAVAAVLTTSVTAAPKGGGKSSGSGNGGNGNGNGGNGNGKPLTLTKPNIGIGNSNGNQNNSQNNGNKTLTSTKLTGISTKDIKTGISTKDIKVVKAPFVSKDQKNLNIDFSKHKDWCGVKFNQGYCFKGFNQCHWDHKCWFGNYGCYCHYCPVSICYYYWCVPDGCWYPTSYCPYGKFSW